MTGALLNLRKNGNSGIFGSLGFEGINGNNGHISESINKSENPYN